MDPMLFVPEHPHDQVNSASKVRICFALKGHRAVEETPRLPGRVSTSSGQQAQGKAVVGQGEARTPSFGGQSRVRVGHVGVGQKIRASLWCGVGILPYQIAVPNRGTRYRPQSVRQIFEAPPSKQSSATRRAETGFPGNSYLIATNYRSLVESHQCRRCQPIKAWRPEYVLRYKYVCG